MVLELQGVPRIGFEEETPDRKSIIVSRSFGQAVTTKADLEQAIAVYMARAAEKMRRQRLAAAALSVFVETSPFRPADLQYTASRAVRLPVASADTGKLIKAALAALALIWKPGYRYKKAGVCFIELVPADRVQPGLFDQPDDERSQARMRAIDSLNARYGRGTIAYRSPGERQRWTMRRECVSPRYTTDWSELLRA